MKGTHSVLRRLLGASIVVSAAVGGVIGGAVGPAPTATAVAGITPLLYLDATNPSSYSGTGTSWLDLSGNGRHGTIQDGNVGDAHAITYNSATKAMEFPGTDDGIAWVDLAGSFANFSGGITIEFEGEFGASRAAWERIFDFADGIDSTADSFWVGQYNSTNELGVEVWDAGVSQGYCTTSTSGTALGTGGSRDFAKWIITLGDVSGTNKCRIYKDGVELDTRVFDGAGANPTATTSGGSNYPLPSNVTRSSNLLGRSNFSADNDFEGSIRYIRLYGQPLTPSEVADNATSTVTFDVNGGTGSMAAQDSTGAAALTANTFTRSGYTFNGWNTAANGSGTAYADTAQYPFSSDATLYAQWTAIPRTVSFDANGGTGSMSPQTTNTATALTANSFTRAGFSFSGWNTAANGSGVAYAGGASYPFNADITLFAQWTALPNKTVTFDANGGTGSMPPQAANVATALNANSFTRAGFSFTGWNSAANGSGTPYAGGASYPFASDATLYAQWLVVPSEVVTFDANGGTGTMAPQSANVPTALTTSTLVRAGYSFSGWNSAANGSATAYADAASYPFSASVTLYAQWTALPNRIVTFAANGGGGSMAPQTANQNTVLTANGFTRSGFTFTGWNTAPGGTGTAYADAATYGFSSDVTLHAQWTPLPSAEYVPIVPGRLFDSRRSTPIVGKAEAREVEVVGTGGIPADAAAVVLNITVTRPAAGGYLTVYPCGEPRPETSSVNFDAGTEVANHVTVKVGAGGKICIYSSVTTDAIIDANGAYSLAAGADHLAPMTPARLFDSRSAGGRILPATPKELTVIGAAGISAGTSAVVLNVTVTDPTAAGYLTVYPCGQSVPEVSNLNFEARQTVANLVTAKVGAGGAVCFATSVPAHLVVDVTATMRPDGPTRFSPLSPSRALDTRSGSRLAAGVPLEVTLAGHNGVRSDAVAVALNVTVTDPSGGGYLTVYPCSAAVPEVSTLNFVAGSTIANAATVGLAAGKVCVVSTVATHLVIDVNGEYTPSS